MLADGARAPEVAARIDPIVATEPGFGAADLAGDGLAIVDVTLRASPRVRFSDEDATDRRVVVTPIEHLDGARVWTRRVRAVLPDAIVGLDTAPRREVALPGRARHDPVGGTMHVALHTALVVTALAAAAVLFLPRGDRLFPGVALLAAGLETLLALGVLSLSITHFRIDLVLAGMLVVAGAICWSRAPAKSAIAASTVVVLIGALQLLVGVHVLR